MELTEPHLQQLARSPRPAVPLARVPAVLGTGGGGRDPGARTRTLEALRRRPELIRVLDGWRGPWRTLGPDPTTLPADVREALERQGMAEPVWLVPLGRAEEGAPAHPALRRLRISVRYLGRVVDAESPRAVTRWIRIVREAALLEAGSGRPTTHPPGPPSPG